MTQRCLHVLMPEPRVVSVHVQSESLEQSVTVERAVHASLQVAEAACHWQAEAAEQAA